jgi:hypothetical protein
MKTCRGVGIPTDGTFMLTLIFADDLVFTAQDEYDLEFMLKCLHKIYNNWGLKLNVTKKEYLSTSFHSQETEVTACMKVQAEHFKYLGLFSIRRD